jgi:hypothetical protein
VSETERRARRATVATAFTSPTGSAPVSDMLAVPAPMRSSATMVRPLGARVDRGRTRGSRWHRSRRPPGRVRARRVVVAPRDGGDARMASTGRPSASWISARMKLTPAVGAPSSTHCCEASSDATRRTRRCCPVRQCPASTTACRCECSGRSRFVTDRCTPAAPTRDSERSRSVRSAIASADELCRQLDDRVGH